MTNDDVMDVVNKEIEDAIDRSFIILRTRIDQFGTSQPNIQRLQGTGRIQIEIPGAETPERIRKLLQGVAKLEFWEVANPDEYLQSLISINDMLVEQMEEEQYAWRRPIETVPYIFLMTLLNKILKVFLRTLSGDLASDLATEDTTALAEADSLANDVLDSLSTAGFSTVFSCLRSQQELVYELQDTSW